MLVHKLVEFNLNGQLIPGMITAEKENKIIISYANPEFDINQPYLSKELHKDGTERDEFLRMTQYVDTGIKKINMEELVQTYLDNDQMDDLLSEYLCSGDVSCYKYQVFALNRMISYAQSRKLVITDLDSYDFENDLLFIFKAR